MSLIVKAGKAGKRVLKKFLPEAAGFASWMRMESTWIFPTMT